MTCAAYSTIDWLLSALNVCVLLLLLPKAVNEFRKRYGKPNE